MAETIAFENGRIFNFEGLVTLTLTLTLDRVILHTVVHHSSTYTYTPNFTEIEETFCGRTDVRTDGRIHRRTFETALLGPHCRRVGLKWKLDIQNFRRSVIIARGSKLHSPLMRCGFCDLVQFYRNLTRGF